MQIWNMSHSNKGFAITCYDTPFYVRPIQNFADFFFGKLTFHLICCRMPEFFWKIPLGKPEYKWKDDPDCLSNSLAAKLSETSTRMMVAFHKKEKNVLSLPITNEQAEKIDPDWYADCIDIFGEGE